MAKRVMSYFKKQIYKNEYGYYMVAKGDGTDEIFETVEEAMRYIEELIGD